MLLYISNLHILLFLVHIYILSYHVFQLTLTKRLVNLVQQFNFQTRCGHQMPLNDIWLDSRLHDLSIESKNTHNRVLTKELCKLQAVKKISNLQHLQQQQQPLSFVIFGGLNFIFDTGSLYLFQLTLTKRLVNLVQQFNFQTRCGHQMPLNGIWLYSRLNELSIESKNTHNGVLKKELCKLQAMKKISNL